MRRFVPDASRAAQDPVRRPSQRDKAATCSGSSRALSSGATLGFSRRGGKGPPIPRRDIARGVRAGASVALLGLLTFGQGSQCLPGFSNDSDSVVASIVLTDEPVAQEPRDALHVAPTDPITLGDPRAVLVSKETLRIVTNAGAVTDFPAFAGDFIGASVGLANAGLSLDVFVQTEMGLYYIPNMLGGMWGEPVLIAAHTFKRTDSGRAFVVQNVGGDSRSDVVVSVPVHGNPPSSVVRTYINDGAGGFTEPNPSVTIPEYTLGLHSLDIDNDTRPDVVLIGGISVVPLRRNAQGGLDFIDAVTGVSPSTYLAGDVGMGVVITGGTCADINGDARPDLVVTASGLVRSRLAQGPAGTFGPRVNYTDSAASGPREPVVLNLDDDPEPELVYPNFGSAGMTMWQVSPDGTFFGRVLHTTGDGPSVCVPYTGEDGETHIGVVCENDHSFLGLINSPVLGGIASGVRLPGAARAACVGDMDGDQYPDLAVSLGSDMNFHLNMGDASGRLKAPIVRAPISVFNHLVTVPVPGSGYDSRCYILGAINGSGTIAALRANVNGQTVTFPTAQAVVAPLPSVGLATGDFNLDGRVDLAAAHASATTSVSIALQLAGGGFGTPVSLPAAPGSWSGIAVGDLDNANGPDIVLANPQGDVARLLNNGSGSFVLQPSLVFGQPIAGVVVSDVTADDRLDLLALDTSGTGSIYIRDADALGGYEPLRTIPLGVSPVSMTLADMNNDHAPDIVLAVPLGADRNGVTRIMLNNGAGAFDPLRFSDHAAGGAPGQIVLADLHNSVQSRGASLPATAGPEVIVVNAGPPPRFQGVTIQPNIHDFGAQPVCVGDANGDNVVDFLDLNIVLSDFGLTGAPGALMGDVDDDGDCDFVDLNIVLSAFGTSC